MSDFDFPWNVPDEHDDRLDGGPIDLQYPNLGQ